MSIAQQVRELEEELEKFKRLQARAVEFLREVGPKDPRGGSFIAERVLYYLGEPSNYVLSQVYGKEDE
jgi:hypothetical protein